MSTQTNIMIATPAYNSQVHTDFVHTLIEINNTGLKFALQTIGNESLITRARNSLISNFWHLENFTHILFLDADVYLDAKGLLQMLAHEKDVIGAPVYLKGKDEHGRQTLNTDAGIDQEPSLQVANRIGTAVFLLSREAVESLINDAIKDKRVYRINKKFQKNAVTDKNYDIFTTQIVNNEYLSEDFSVCHKLKSLGYKIYVDTSVYTRHSGMATFD